MNLAFLDLEAGAERRRGQNIGGFDDALATEAGDDNIDGGFHWGQTS